MTGNEDADEDVTKAPLPAHATASQPSLQRRRPSRAVMLLGAVELVLVALLLLSACTRDKSRLTSPSARALLSVTAPTLLAFAPASTPPTPVDAPEGWALTVDLARFGKLEDGTPALAILLDLDSEAGAAMDLWFSDDGGVLARWSGGVTEDYRGDVCFQLPLVSEDGEHALPLAGSTGHTLTVAFLDASGGVIVSTTRGVASFVPQVSGASPGASDVFRDLLACP